MPANLPPEYFEAEQRFKQATNTSDKISALEDLIATVPKHKGTDKLRADLRRRLSQLRKEGFSKKGGRRTDLYTIPKEGAAQLVLVGFANSGKSSLLSSLTNASPVVADYPLSTLLPLPGMMPYEDIQFQLVDLPPLGNESTDGWVSGMLRNADALLIIIDLTDDPDVQAALLIEQLERWNIQTQKYKDGDDRQCEQKFRTVKPVLFVANKKDMLGTEISFSRLKESSGNIYPLIAVSALRKENLEELKKEIFTISGIIRVYAKPPGKEPDLTTPFTLSKGSTVLDIAGIIHKDLSIHLKYARIWGSARFDGQKVEKNYLLQDKDIVEIQIS